MIAIVDVLRQLKSELADSSGTIHIEMDYRFVRFDCTECDLHTTEVVSTAAIYRNHGNHLEMVTVEIQIASTGETWVCQPAPMNLC